VASYQYIFTMKGLSKIHPPDKKVLEDIWLAFLPGAKIGVLGANGAGKSTLLRIMAGLDKDFAGEAFAAEGVSVGFLPQEPALDPEKTVLGNIEEGVAETRALLAEYERLSERLGEDLSSDEMDKVLEQQGKLQDRIDAASAWDLDSRVELAMDALRVPPGEADVRTLSGGERRRVALAMLLAQDPELLLLDEPTNHLDVAHEVRSLELLARLARGARHAVVMALHDLTLAARHATHAILLGCDGAAAGPAAELLNAERLSELSGQALVAVPHPRGTAFLPD